MEIKSYINILIILLVIIITYYAINYGNIVNKMEALNTIKIPKYDNIDSYDIKQLKTIVNEQNDIITKQSEIINDYINKNEKKFYKNEIKPDEDFENYFKQLQLENDKIIESNSKNEDIDILNHYKKHLNIVKTYLEDPVTRGSNIYESELYSKLLDVGNIKLSNGYKLPHPNNYSINISLEDKWKKGEKQIDEEYFNTSEDPDRTKLNVKTTAHPKQESK
jgi:hypothetical protein